MFPVLQREMKFFGSNCFVTDRLNCALMELLSGHNNSMLCLSMSTSYHTGVCRTEETSKFLGIQAPSRLSACTPYVSLPWGVEKTLRGSAHAFFQGGAWSAATTLFSNWSNQQQAHMLPLALECCLCASVAGFPATLMRETLGTYLGTYLREVRHVLATPTKASGSSANLYPVILSLARNSMDHDQVLLPPPISISHISQSTLFK